MSISTKSNQTLLFKLLSLFSVVRGYNILTLVIAQYLASVFIFSPEKSLKVVLLDINLFFIVLASVCVIASGYIINNFYDKEKDKINRPVKSKIDSYVSQNTKLTMYFALNFIGVCLAYLVSWKAAVFFSVYIFLIWFYSHKLKKYPIVGVVSASILTILPFFAIFVYFKNFSNIIFVHAFFLFLLLLIRELMKNLENMDGDLLSNYQTVTVRYGERFTKMLGTALTVLLVLPVYFLWQYPEIGWMKYYFLITVIGIPLFLFLLWRASTKNSYRILHNLLKILIFAGIFSLIMIDTSIVARQLIHI